MPYVSVSPQYAEQLSRGIMRLLRPSHLRDDNWTDLYCGIVTHPTTGETALNLPENETVPIHAQADGAELSALLNVFVEDGSLTQEEADGIGVAVRLNAGKKVSVIDFIPPSWQPYVYTYEEMEENGWWAVNEEGV
jgi:hypothetical protein